MGSGEPHQPTWRAAFAGLVVGIVVASGVFAGWAVTRPNATAGPPVIDDGPTLYGALRAINESVRNQPGGPWTLYGVWGIATPLPFSPTSIPWPRINESVNSCSAEFSGVTLWNSTIPLFNGTFNSGTAPFWQFVFFSNASQSIEVATDVLGTAHVYAPMPYNSTCAESTWLSTASPWNWALMLTSFPVDSSVAAKTAWAEGGSEWTSNNPGGYVTYYYGFAYWGSGNLIGNTVKYSRCGIVGFAGVQPVQMFITNPGGSLIQNFNGTQGCGNVYRLDPTIYAPYVVDFSIPKSSGADASTWVTMTLGLTSPPLDNTFPATYDAGGLVTWMVALNLTNAGSSAQGTGAPGCSQWVSNLSSCSGNATGWFAVLTSASGGWLDSFGTTLHGSAWVIPNAAFVSQQHITIVIPSSWNVTGDSLSISSTTQNVTASGSANL